MTNRIHPTALIGPQVELGTGNTVGPYCVLQGRVVLGDDNFLAAHVSVGGGPEVRGHALAATWEEPTEDQPVIIGSRNVLKEFVAVNGGWATVTRLGDDGYLMGHVHVNHDCVVGDEVTLSGSVVLAGHVIVGDGANLGLGAVVHQRRVVGAGAMVGMQAAVTRDLPPYVVSHGVPARPSRLNAYRLDRLGVPAEAHPALATLLLHGGVADLPARLPAAVTEPVLAWARRDPVA